MDLDEPDPINAATPPTTIPLTDTQNRVDKSSIDKNHSAADSVGDKSILDDDTPLPVGLKAALMPINARVGTSLLARHGGLSTSKWASD
jgi:hypothetical protein